MSNIGGGTQTGAPISSRPTTTGMSPGLPRRRGRALLTLLAATVASAAVLAAIDAQLGIKLIEHTGDPQATYRPGQARYCPGSDPTGAPVAARACCDVDPAASDGCVQAFRGEAGEQAVRLATAWLWTDIGFALLYTLLIVLACLWAVPAGVLRRWLALPLAIVALAAGVADMVENLTLLGLLGDLGDSAAATIGASGPGLAARCATIKGFIAAPIVGLLLGVFWWRWELVGRHLAYFAVLRPSFVFGAVLLFLPLTAIATMPLSSVLGNLLVDYDFWPAFWLGVTLFPTVWSLMFTTCLLLDSERHRDDGWIHDPGDAPRRTVTLPIEDPWIFGAFTAMALPTVAVVLVTAASTFGAAVGLALGGALAYLGLDLSLSILRCGRAWRPLPWTPLVARLMPGRVSDACEWLSGHFRIHVTRAARWVRMPHYLFDGPPPKLLMDDHVFAVWSLGVMLILYVGLSLFLWRAVVADHFGVFYALPPIGFLYVLLVLAIWGLTPLWFMLRRYRLALAVLMLVAVTIYTLSGTKGATYTFDAATGSAPLSPAEVLAQINRDDPGRQRPIVIVAASGGGIAAAGWTAKVLSELYQHIPDFPSRLRLLSTVSGGSVGTAHYLHALDADTIDAARLSQMIAASMDTSLSMTAYAFAFPEVQRTFFPFASGPNSDRGRLQERNWRARVGGAERKLLSDFTEQITAGTRPAVIFNTTLMETGGRVALTNTVVPVSATNRGAPRLNGARSLTQLLEAEDGEHWSVDVWTGARLSATFSYVSPPAAFAAIPKGQRAASPAARHLIDGGYHDNFGVASALDWIELARDDLGGRPVAIVEIRASPQSEAVVPADGLTAEWFGPALGMWNSWWRSQTETNDTALARLAQTSDGKIKAFVFTPSFAPALSWHLSRAQQQQICEAWGHEPRYGRSNREELHDLLDFLGVSAAGGNGAEPYDRVPCMGGDSVSPPATT